jgi:hypothetical protein
MADKLRHKESVRQLYNRLWYEWAYSFGACTAIVVVSFVCSQLVLPAIAIVMAWALTVGAELKRRQRKAHCLLIVRHASRTLGISALVMLVCLVFNRKTPYIATLIVYSVFVGVLAVFLITRDYNKYCSNCKVRHGLSPKEAFVGNLLHNESKYQVRLSFYLSLLISALGWVYYFNIYSNEYITRTDTYCFVGIPVIIYALSLIYLAVVYQYSVHILHADEIELGINNITTLRYLVLKGDLMLLGCSSNKLVPGTMTIDTPASVNIEYMKSVSDQVAAAKFEDMSGTKNFILRRLYSNDSISGTSNVFHYAVIMDECEGTPDNWTLGEDWSTLDQINRLWRTNAISPALAAEFHRIYAITMAWKTYDRNGYRLYPIKNYHPTFRLRNFKEWDVDYSDMRWIYISENNEDKPMFKVRQLIKKIYTLHAK